MDQDKSNNSTSEENALETPPEMNALDNLSAADASGGNRAEPPSPDDAVKKQSRFRRIWNGVNVYLLIFFLLIIVTGIVFVVSYLNSQKEPETPAPALQDLTQEQLNEIATGDASVGDPRYVLNVQSDAVFAGNALIRGDLNVAGRLQLGEGLNLPSVVVTGNSNLNDVQINSLAVAEATTLQGALTVRNSVNISRNLSVGGGSTFNGGITATSITTGSLTLAGDGGLVLGNHLKVNGPNPSRSNGGSIGSGGSTSVSGTDTSGVVNINTGSGPSSGCLVNVNFVNDYDGNPQVLLTPANAAAANLNYYSQRSSTGFSICGTNPQGGRTYVFDYFVIN